MKLVRKLISYLLYEPIHSTRVLFLVPNYANISKRAGTELTNFRDAVFPEGYGIGAPRGSGGAKRAKPDVSDVDIEIAANEGTVLMFFYFLSTVYNCNTIFFV